ncbi:TetR/AcrR family transcriptional regulator [Aeromicrobium sp. UC242_57]|uniref:TetR/AcrR family transcriptional regulator n=1 Tax=Aeromicrobium sp. UC242_57 TaxID=3374624 RepID=UPI0037A4AA26
MPHTRDLIAASAKRLFEAHGFSGTSVRAIAAEAGADPSLVIRHFGSKQALFLEVLGLDEYVRPPIDGPLDDSASDWPASCWPRSTRSSAPTTPR